LNKKKKKPAFNNVSRGHLVGRDLVRWTESFVSDHKVRLILNAQEGRDHEVETGIPQGSPVSPIFTAYLSGLFGYVEERDPGVKALSFVNDVAWTTEGDNEDGISQTLERGLGVGGGQRGHLRHGKNGSNPPKQTEETQEPDGPPPRGIQVAGCTVHFNAQATRWLGVWLDSQLTLKEHHENRMKKARNAQNRLRRLAGRC